MRGVIVRGGGTLHYTCTRHLKKIFVNMLSSSSSSSFVSPPPPSAAGRYIKAVGNTSGVGGRGEADVELCMHAYIHTCSFGCMRAWVYPPMPVQGHGSCRVYPCPPPPYTDPLALLLSRSLALHTLRQTRHLSKDELCIAAGEASTSEPFAPAHTRQSHSRVCAWQKQGRMDARIDAS